MYLDLSFICLFVIFSINGFTQTPQINSLNTVIASIKTDTIRLNSLLQLSEIHYNQSEYELALRYAKESETLAIERGKNIYLGGIYSTLSAPI